ncbi:MAG: hypothetical protein EON95_00440 [Caulobacteraceae bacterium]|nr:MAG: hypothetical protein EON95_00440 [Caulobacteraceae bacterium]
MDRRLALAALLALAPTAALAPPAMASGGEKKKGGGASFIQIQTLTASIMRRNGSRGVITMEVGIDVENEALRERANASTPRLRAAYTQVLQMYAAGLPAAMPPDADYLALRCQRETDRLLGKPGAKLLIGTILVN